MPEKKSGGHGGKAKGPEHKKAGEKHIAHAVKYGKAEKEEAAAERKESAAKAEGGGPKGKEGHMKDGAKKGAVEKAELGKQVREKAGGEKAQEKAVAGKTKAEKEKPEKKVVKVSKSSKVKALSARVRAKRRRLFRGRFGKKSIRKISNKKWQKWRRPKGIDIYFNIEDGLVPDTGYRTDRAIRFVHPSGYREKLVRNVAELEAIESEKEFVAARLSGKLGKRKKRMILGRADELKIAVLNR